MVFSIDLTFFIYCFLLEQELFSGCCSPFGDLVPCLHDSCGAWILLSQVAHGPGSLQAPFPELTSSTILLPNVFLWLHCPSVSLSIPPNWIPNSLSHVCPQPSCHRSVQERCMGSPGPEPATLLLYSVEGPVVYCSFIPFSFPKQEFLLEGAV